MAHILVIDDDLDAFQSLKTHLAPFPYQCSQLPENVFLFEYLKTHLVDLIILGVPYHESQLWVLQQLKQHEAYHTSPILVVIQEQEDQQLETLFANGALDYITKPIQKKTLSIRVKTALDTYNSQKTVATLLQRTKELEEENSELMRVNDIYQLFVPKQFFNRVLKKKLVKSGQFEEEKLTILFADIRAYTNHVENMTPEESFDFLNDFFEVVEPSISNNQGFVDKFLGDGVMAIFDQDNSANSAVKAAIEMQQALSKYNQTRVANHLPEVHFGIGINTGTVMIGAVGSPTRLNSTVIGDQVNLTARLEELTKKFNAPILISHHTYAEMAPNDHCIREIDTVRVKGRSQPVSVYEVFDCDPGDLKEKKLKTQSLLFKAITLYKMRNFSEALETLEKCMDEFPQDVIVLNYVKRCRYFQKYPPVLDANEIWYGIINDHDTLIDQKVRRRSTRYSIVALAEVYPYGTERHYAGMVRDISIRGLKLIMSLPCQEGDIFFVEVYFEKETVAEFLAQKSHKILGRVAWAYQVVGENGRIAWEVGMEINIMTLEQEELLQNALYFYKTRAFISDKNYRIQNDLLIYSPNQFPTEADMVPFKKELGVLLTNRRSKGMILNLKHITTLRSSEIGNLLSILNVVRTHHARFVMCNVNPESFPSIETTQLGRIIDIYPTEKQAVESFEPGCKSIPPP